MYKTTACIKEESLKCTTYFQEISACCAYNRTWVQIIIQGFTMFKQKPAETHKSCTPSAQIAGFSDDSTMMGDACELVRPHGTHKYRNFPETELGTIIICKCHSTLKRGFHVDSSIIWWEQVNHIAYFCYIFVNIRSHATRIFDSHVLK